MTRTRVGGRSSDRATSLAAAFLPLLIALGFVVACGDRVPTDRPSASASASSSPAGASGSAEASRAVGPRGTPWPGNAVLGIEALGVADGPILAAINDFNAGIASEDLALMRRAADGLAGLDVLLPNLEKIGIYEPMRPFADRYGSAIRGISDAARGVRSAIDAGDAAAITSSSRALIASLSTYTDVQPELATWVEQSIDQRRLLVR